MELAIAKRLIEKTGPFRDGQVWYDLGAGSGLFTCALAEILKTGTITAIDKDARAISSLPDHVGSVSIVKRVGDFSIIALPRLSADGVLMANSLHFVRDKASFLKMLSTVRKEAGIVIIIEYEMTTANPWVPFPVDFQTLTKLAGDAGFRDVVKIASTPSKFQSAGIYSARLF